jgi:hypothetical protein
VQEARQVRDPGPIWPASGHIAYNRLRGSCLPDQGVLLYLAAFLKRTMVKLAETCAEALEEVGDCNRGVKSFPQLLETRPTCIISPRNRGGGLGMCTATPRHLTLCVAGTFLWLAEAANSGIVVLRRTTSGVIFCEGAFTIQTWIATLRQIVGENGLELHRCWVNALLHHETVTSTDTPHPDLCGPREAVASLLQRWYSRCEGQNRPVEGG